MNKQMIKIYINILGLGFFPLLRADTEFFKKYLNMFLECVI